MSSEESRGTSRSAFLKRAAGTTMVVAGAGVGAGAFAQQAAAASGRSYTAGRFSLEIDGVNCGRLVSADGGGLEYDVVRDQMDPASGDFVQPKHLGAVKYEDFTIQAGSNMDSPLHDWIKDSFDKGVSRKSGAIIAADYNHNELSRRQFTNAFITEVGLPKLDGASSTDPGFITVRFSAASVADVKGSGAPVVSTKQKAFLPSNFRFIAKGLDTTRVASIDSFTWTLAQRPAGSSARLVDPGPLVASMDIAALPSWQRWYDNFAVGGDGTDERNGILELVGENGAVLNVGLFNCGIYLLKPSADKIKRFNVELYVERASWDLVQGKKV